MIKKKSALIFGFGRMGHVYLNIIKKMGFNNIEVIEKQNKNIKIAQQIYNIKKEKIFKSIKKLHLEKSYEIVIISTTTDAKFLNFKKIASKKIKFVFFEKPLCSSLNECYQIDKIAKKNKIKVGINHQSRFTKEIDKIFKLVKDFKGGDLKSINLFAGNIGIAMNGIHIIELFNYLTKSPIVRVNAIFEKKYTSNPRGKKFKDFAGQIICKNKKHNILTINTSKEYRHGFNLNFIFKTGFVYLDYLNGNLYFNFRKKKYHNKNSNYYGLPSVIKKKRIKISSIKEGTEKNLAFFIMNKRISNFNDGINAIKVLSAASISSKRKGKEVFLKNFQSKKIFKWA